MENLQEVQLCVKNLFCYLCHQSFPDFDSFKGHEHNYLQESGPGQSNVNLHLSSSSALIPTFELDEDGQEQVEEQDTNSSTKRGNPRKRRRIAPNSKSSTKENIPVKNSPTAKKPRKAALKRKGIQNQRQRQAKGVKSTKKDKNKPKEKDKTAVKAYLTRLGDFFHCTKCYDTFYKLVDLVVHFKQCQGNRSSICSFKEFKTQQDHDKENVALKSTESDLLNCSQNNNTNITSTSIEQEHDSSANCDADPVIVQKGHDPENESNSSDLDLEESSSKIQIQGQTVPETEETQTHVVLCHVQKPQKVDEEVEDEDLEDEESSGESQPFSCPVCFRGFAVRRYMLEHQRRIHGEKSHKCPVAPCTQAFVQRNLLVHHLKFSHPGSPALQAPELASIKCYTPHCNLQFPDRASLKAHRLAAHGSTSTSNTTLSFNVTLTPGPDSASGSSDPIISITRNTENSNSLICFECGKTLSSIYTYQKHVQGHQGQKPYPCSHPGCDKAYVSKAHYLEHERTHNVDLQFKCTIDPDNCTLSFVNMALLKDHINTAHADSPASAFFICEQCGLSLATRHQHYQHSLKHRERPHQCPYPNCDKRFQRLEQLRKHLAGGQCQGQGHGGGNDSVSGKIRTRTRFPCTFVGCWKDFASSPRLEQHVQIAHQGVQKYICSFCGKGDFPNSASFKRHLKLGHGGHPHGDEGDGSQGNE